MPVFTRFDVKEGRDHPESCRVTWIDVNTSIAEDHAWLMSWDDTRAHLLVSYHGSSTTSVGSPASFHSG